MTQLPSQRKSLSIWQRLLLIFNLGGPQWGRPNGDRKDKGAEDEELEDQQGSWPENEEEQSGNERPQDQRPKNRPERRPAQPKDAPPDLDEIWKDWSDKLGGLLGGGNGGGGRRPKRPQRSGGMPPVSGKSAGATILIVLFFVFLAWVGSGLFTVQEGQRAVILRFGEYQQPSRGPGLSWRFPYPIETHEIIATDQLKSVDIGNANINTITGLNNASMLTQDKNILDIRFTVQYRIKDIESFLFYNVNPDDAVTQAAESAVREVVGRSPMDVVIQRESCSATPLTPAEIQAARKAQNTPQEVTASSVTVSATGSSIDSVIEQIDDENVLIPRETIIDNAKATCDGTKQESLSNPIHESIQSQLDKLNTGIEIFNVNILDVQVPDKVKPAFDEARSATAERASLINEGWAYANSTIASAKGVVARLEADANAYKASAVSKATGEAERFKQIYEQYRLSPDITRRRMYLETMQDIYSNVSKVMMEPGNNSLIYLPLDKLMNQQQLPERNTSSTTTETNPVLSSTDTNIDAMSGNSSALPASSYPSSSVATPQQNGGVRNVSRAR